MADKGRIRAIAGSLEPDVKQAFVTAFEYTYDNLTLGPIEHQRRATNLQLYFLNSTTHADAGTQFSVLHGLARTPQVVLQVLNPSRIGAQFVRLATARAADASRVYFTSSDTSAAFTLLVG